MSINVKQLPNRSIGAACPSVTFCCSYWSTTVLLSWNIVHQSLDKQLNKKKKKKFFEFSGIIFAPLGNTMGKASILKAIITDENFPDAPCGQLSAKRCHFSWL